MERRILSRFRWVVNHPYWSKLVRQNERCSKCGFPAEKAPNGDFCPYCGFPDNPDGLDNLCIG